MVTALFVRKDSIYKKLGIDCYDMERDARTWPGGNAVICHPPCRAWGRLSHFAKPRIDEKELAIMSVDLIRIWGGILEHPVSSKLWSLSQLPLPGTYDEYGGFTICVDQFWWGHLAKKNTFLYIVGIVKSQLPPIPIKYGYPEFIIGTYKKKKTGYVERLKKFRNLKGKIHRKNLQNG